MPRGSAGLLLTMAGWIALIAVELSIDAHRDPPLTLTRPASTPPTDPPAHPNLALGPLSEWSQTPSRPLFRLDRRPLVRASVPKVAAEAPIPQPIPDLLYLLSAVVIAQDQALAYLSKPSDAGLTQLRQGETVDGWRLVEVRPDAVVLEHGEHRTSLALRPQDQSAGSGTSDSFLRDSLSRELEGRGNDGDIRDREIEPRSPKRPRRGPRQEALERALRRALPDPPSSD